jgi:rod shape-determining protein MreD
MRKIFPFIFILALALLQITLVPKMAIFGVKPNLVLVGLSILLFTSNFLNLILSAVLGGLIYDVSDYFFGLNIIVLILTFFIFWFLGKKYVASHHFLSLLSFSVFGTAIFNFLYTSLSYLIFHYNFFDYFLSWRHLLEMAINGALTFIFGGLFLIGVNIKKENAAKF